MITLACMDRTARAILLQDGTHVLSIQPNWIYTTNKFETATILTSYFTTFHNSLLSGLFPLPVFDQLKYANTEGNGDLVTSSDIR